MKTNSTVPASQEKSKKAPADISKGSAATDNHAAFVEDKRQTARHEHTGHFTNRAPQDKK